MHISNQAGLNPSSSCVGSISVLVLLPEEPQLRSAAIRRTAECCHAACSSFFLKRTSRVLWSVSVPEFVFETISDKVKLPITPLLFPPFVITAQTRNNSVDNVFKVI